MSADKPYPSSAPSRGELIANGELPPRDTQRMADELAEIDKDGAIELQIARGQPPKRDPGAAPGTTHLNRLIRQEIEKNKSPDGRLF